MNRKIKEAIFCGNGQNICLRPMEEKDIPQVARLYRQIAVTEKNYTDKLSENSPSSFSKTGGMFLIQDEESLPYLLETNTVLLACGEGDKLLGLLVYASCGEELELVELLSGTAEVQRVLQQKRDGFLAYGGEVIVSPDNDASFLFLSLFCVMLESLWNNGLKGVCGEVYRVVQYTDRRGSHEADLLNRRSLASLKRIGAKQIGTLPVREIALKGLEVTVEPLVLYFDLAETVPVLRDFLNEKGFLLTEPAPKNLGAVLYGGELYEKTN